MNFLSKLKLAFFLAFLLLFTSTVKSARAEMDLQDWWDASGSDQPPSMAVMLNNDGWTAGTLSGWACQLTGCYTNNNEQLSQGAIPTTSNAIALAIANPPIKTSAFVADILDNGFGLAQPAYAQGFGFNALSPVLRIWKAFRNIAYFIFVIIFVIMGFLIMFRAKLDPQTVINIQTALPKLIITLILITFSYAIASLIVDLIYLLIYIIIAIFNSFDLITKSTSDLSDIFFGENIFGIGFRQLLGSSEAAGRAAKAVTEVVNALLGDKQIIQTINRFTGQPLAYVIIAVAILIALFRTFFILLASYISIIISVVFAPIQIMLNALPGSNTFSTWLRNLAANAAVFPTVALMILLGVVMIGPSGNNEFGVAPDIGFQDTSQEGFVPPFILKWGETASNSIQGIIGLGIIMLLPQAAQMIKKSLQVEPSGMGAAAAAGIFAGPKVVGAAVGTPLHLLSQLGYASHAFQQLTGKELPIPWRKKIGGGPKDETKKA